MPHTTRTGHQTRLESRSKRFLVVEDDPDISDLLALHLPDLGAEISVVQDGVSGRKRALDASWDLVLLDLQLPGMDGLEICRAIRAQSAYVPVMILTSRSTELDRVLGLEMGADDYLVKPFSIAELKARIRALLRRSDQFRGDTHPHTEVLSFADLSIEYVSRQVRVKEQPIALTAKEFDLLWFFASHPGVVFRRAELLDQVWGYGHEGYEHTVNSHINRLRTKLDAVAPATAYIRTVWGVGYRFGDV